MTQMTEQQTTTATERATAWFGALEAALTAQDVAAAADLAATESYWRDLVAFSWNLVTVEHREGVSELLESTARATAARSFALSEEATEEDGVITAWFTFETAVGRGRGLARLVTESGEDRAWTFLTTLYELKGHEEPRGEYRPKGAEHGVDPQRLSWKEKREAEDAAMGVSTQPYVLVVGGGQGGIALGARLRQLGVPSLVLDRNELMSTRMRFSEEQLADLTIDRLGKDNARVLIGGYGMGFTYRAAAAKLGRFAALEAQSAAGVPLFLARTGYTGEDGFEIVLPEGDAVAFWNVLLEAGVKPAGLGARDTLRLEAGMNLYGQDMDEGTTPWEAALAWTVALDDAAPGQPRDFIGRAVLEAQKAAGAPRQMIGLVMDEKGVLRHGQKVLTAQGEGEILSGTFSPTLGKAIAFARVPAGDPGQVRVDIRGREVPVRVVRFPFVREGQAQPGVLG